MNKNIFFGDKTQLFKSNKIKLAYDLASNSKTIFELKSDIICLPDLILILFYAQREQPIKGMIPLMKEMFLVQMEYVKEENIQIQETKFLNYRYGPYSIDIDKMVGLMEHYGLILSRGMKSSNKERFYLTKKGEEIAKEEFMRLNKHQQLKLKTLRKGWDQLGVEGILDLVYTKYPKFINEPKILKTTLRQYEVNRIRG